MVYMLLSKRQNASRSWFFVYTEVLLQDHFLLRAVSVLWLCLCSWA